MSPRPIRWGFIGASLWASRYLIPAVAAQPDAVSGGVFSSSRERGEEFAASNGLKQAYGSLGELLADDGIDAVYISTTNDLHAEQTIAAAQAGKHVLCEKPLALNVEDALRMREACAAAGVVFATDHHLRAAPTIARMRELVAAGDIGELVAGRVFHAGKLGAEFNGWRLDRPEAGGGVALDLTVHDADVVRFLFADEVAEVSALGANQGLADAGLEDSVMGVMRMRGGQVVSFHDSFAVPNAATGVELYGTEGALIGRGVIDAEPVGQVFLRRGDIEEEIEIAERNPIYVEAVRRFDAAVRGEGTPLASGDDGIATLAVATATIESARSGRAVAVREI
jgi:1,5-anhydro-D-fructose reductase (1,5-anhydro-D-mannitol-forming)